ncbi:type II toxin-antitoxin system RelE/ParE family toxin [Salipiger sp. P9]|uniref:type II toxin-antitoxin system RelE/ParE family toxin n=1 Tax=Salipiger pentaromativorans TaxID=2943193 RepID=UPI002158325E|nr:type II toxin-antitoxin system RelE/ParE family toxin [Salipiger pentaromativorans]
MIRQVRLRPRAIGDLDAIWSYGVARWGAAQAAGYLTGLDATFRLLAEFPEMARMRREFAPPARIHPYRDHLILYREEERFIDVLRLPSGRSNWAEFLAE